MSNKDRHGFRGTMSFPDTNRGATFNDGAFVVGATATLATTTGTDIGLTTGASQVVFSGFQVNTDSGELLIEMFGDDTAFTGGTPLVAFNTNKNSEKVASITALVQDPTVSNDGTLQTPPFTILGDNNQNESTSLLSANPLILKPETSYLFRLTHNETGTREVAVLLTAFDNIIDDATFSD